MPAINQLGNIGFWTRLGLTGLGLVSTSANATTSSPPPLLSPSHMFLMDNESFHEDGGRSLYSSHRSLPSFSLLSTVASTLVHHTAAAGVDHSDWTRSTSILEENTPYARYLNISDGLTGTLLATATMPSLLGDSQAFPTKVDNGSLMAGASGSARHDYLSSSK